MKPQVAEAEQLPIFYRYSNERDNPTVENFDMEVIKKKTIFAVRIPVIEGSKPEAAVHAKLEYAIYQ